MDFSFKTLRPGIFIEGVLHRLDESTRDIILDELHAADELLSAAECPKWISVNDRLPAPRSGGNVSWAVLAVEYTGSQVLVAYDYNAARWVGLDYTPRITHWQPLPANPVAVKGDAQGE